MEKLLKQKWHVIRQFFDATAEAIVITDARSRIVYINPSFTEVTGYTLKEVSGKTPRILHSGRQTAAFYARLWKCLKATGRWQGEIWNRRRNGEIYPDLSRPQDAAATARKILRALARPFVLEGHKASVTASIGITVYPFDGNDVETLLKHADGAMYRAKSERRNDYRFWGKPSLYSRAGVVTRRK